MSRAELRRGVALRIGGVGAARSAIVVLPLAVLPVIAAHVDRPEWIAIGIGQSMGAVAAIVAGAGWALTGPPAVALGERDARALLGDALRSTTLLFLAAAPLFSLAAWIVAPEEARLLAAVMTAASATMGISPSWFLAVRGEIRLMLAVDVGPRIVAGVAAAAVVAVGGATAVLWYPILSLVAGLFGPVWCSMRLASRSSRHLTAVLSQQLLPTLTTLVAAGYSAATVTLAALVADAEETAEFTSGFRLFAIAIGTTAVLNQSTQQWARAGRGGSSEERSMALRLYGVLAVVLLCGFAVLGAPASRVLFGDQFAFGRATALGLGLACAVLTLESFVTTHLVVPFGRHSEVLRAALAGAVVGVPATILAAAAFGAPGAAWSLVLSEVAVGIVLLCFARRHRPSAVTSRGV